MFPEWHHAVPESAYFKVPETIKTFRMYSTSRYAPCATRLYGQMVWTCESEGNPGKQFLQGKVEGKRTRGRPERQWLDYVNEWTRLRLNDQKTMWHGERCQSCWPQHSVTGVTDTRVGQH